MSYENNRLSNILRKYILYLMTETDKIAVPLISSGLLTAFIFLNLIVNNN